MAPADPILGLTVAYNQDPNPDKINLGVGVYKDADGRTPVLQAVKDAERRMLAGETSKSYKPIEGDANYASAVQHLLLDRPNESDHEAIKSKRMVTAHTPGGTGGLRVVGDYLKANHPDMTLWLTTPTWANHPNIFQASGVPTKSFSYFDDQTFSLDFDAMIATFEKIPAGDAVLLHGCCHNPTGVDPTPQQWRDIGYLLHKRGVLVILDFAYQGFGDGLVEDAVALHTMLEPGREMLVVSSFSKNFSLYNERVGAVSAVASDAKTAQTVLSQLKRVIRSNYSNPPGHGSAIITGVLNDRGLRMNWEAELSVMRNRINSMRRMFVEKLTERGVDRDFSFIGQQRGMFAMTGFTKAQVDQLREEYAIYIVGSGRVNVAGMTDNNMDRLCDAIAAVLGG